MSPQHKNDPPGRTAQKKLSPTPTDDTVPITGGDTPPHDMEAMSPQQVTVPSVFTPQVRSRPAATET
jgi:hypothetical protein